MGRLPSSSLQVGIITSVDYKPNGLVVRIESRGLTYSALATEVSEHIQEGLRRRDPNALCGTEVFFSPGTTKVRHGTRKSTILTARRVRETPDK